MGSDQTLELKKSIVVSSRHEEADEDHAQRHVLSGNGEEEVVDLHPALVLRYGIAHGENQGANVETEVESNQVVDGLITNC